MEYESEKERQGFIIFFIIILSIIFLCLVYHSIDLCINGEEREEVLEEIELVTGEAGGYIEKNFIDQKREIIEIGGI